MILIISIEDDVSTDQVMQWLQYLSKPFVRINEQDLVFISGFRMDNSQIEYILTIAGRALRYSQIQSVWYRKGCININMHIKDPMENKALKFWLTNEVSNIKKFVEKSLEKKSNSIGNFIGTINKLEVLRVAKKIGLKIPCTYVVNSKKEIQALIKRHGYLISKPISDVLPMYDAKDGHSAYFPTMRVDLATSIPDFFFYSLIQEEIKKDFEIRAFFLNGKVYASAMLTQNNASTKVDSRLYDKLSPTRMIPFELPQTIILKLKTLMQSLDLNTGSFDLIFSNGDYYFLELNPVGQFGMVSRPCNYYLEKLVAESL